MSKTVTLTIPPENYTTIWFTAPPVPPNTPDPLTGLRPSTRLQIELAKVELDRAKKTFKRAGWKWPDKEEVNEYRVREAVRRSFKRMLVLGFSASDAAKGCAELAKTPC